MKPKHKEWTRVPWEGNPHLNLECWRKSFGSGHVSVGIGELLTITFSYGNNSDDSLSSTRWREEGNLTEEEAMTLVDSWDGKYVPPNRRA